MAKSMGLQSIFLNTRLLLCVNIAIFFYLKSEIHALESTSLNFMSQNELIYVFKV